MTWGEILTAIVKKIAGYIAKALLWCLWVTTSGLEVLLRSLNATLKEVIFETKK